MVPNDDTVLFVDDTPGHIEAAAALGIRGHVHTDGATTIEAIDEHLAGAPGCVR